MMTSGLVYEITPRCNLDCGFCYNTWTRDEGTITPLDDGQILRLLDRVIPDAGTRWITFTGGEPLLHPFLFHAIQHCRQYHPRLQIGLASNGTLLTREKIRSLVDAGLDFIEIPLLSGDDELYRRMTGYHQLTRVRENLSQVKQFDLKLNVSVMLSSLNRGQLSTIIETAYAFGADLVTLNRYTPTGRGQSRAAIHSLSRSELKNILILADAEVSRLGIPVSVSLPVRDCDISHDRYPHLIFTACTCGREKWIIDPWGRLRTCEQNEEILGSLLESPFKELVESSQVRTFLERDHFKDCRERECYELCRGGCRFEPE